MTLSEQRARLVRILAGAALAHADDLSELQTFCSLLAMDPLIAADAAEMALRAVPAQEGHSPSKVLRRAEVAPQPTRSIDGMLVMLRGIGVTKRQCLDAMRKANSKFAPPAGFDKMALKDLLRRFYGKSNPDEIARFVEIIGPNELDPYLSGMDRRRQEQR